MWFNTTMAGQCDLMQQCTRRYRSTIRTHKSLSAEDHQGHARVEGPAVGKPFQYFEAMHAAMVEAGMITL